MTVRDLREELEKRLRDAARTQELLSSNGCWPAGYKSCMPEAIRDASESYGWNTPTRTRLRAGNAQISRMDEVLAWMNGAALNKKQRLLLWRRATRVPWKVICQEFRNESGKPPSRPTIHKDHRNALIELASYLIALKQKTPLQHSFSVFTRKSA